MPTPSRFRSAARPTCLVIAAGALLAGCGADGREGAGVDRPAAADPGRVTVPGAGSTTPGTLLEDGSVPWIDAPVPPDTFDIKAPSRREAPADAASCRAEQLTGVLPAWTSIIKRDDFGKRLGDLGLRGEVEVTNAGTVPCTLQGEVPFALLADGRPPEGVQVAHALSDESRARVTTLRPGDIGVLELRWTTPFCGRADTRQRITLELPDDGGSLAVPVLRPRQPECTAQLETESGTRSFLSSGAFDEQRPDTALDSPLGGVDVRIVDAPRNFTPGDPIRFAVELRNPTKRAVRLEPCPGYAATVGAYLENVPPMTSEILRLNCAAVDTIPARGSVRFAMVVPFRAKVRSGSRWSVTWSLRDPRLAPSDGSTAAFDLVAR